ncbi:hypothetical protein DN752_07415 [Echinicola strongylocentroti]|uniref:Uncharacterized protein n=1 Tax=Echinicola strongylocentroti TaxID=1795355 RepID=A0A2Z4IGC8_9BACT|nr:hypothetical protein DN752_07415 [Echinicola strongylocentroti]
MVIPVQMLLLGYILMWWSLGKFLELQTNKATENNQDIYQMGKVGIENVKVSEADVLTYDVIDGVEVYEGAFMNIVFVVKE